MSFTTVESDSDGSYLRITKDILWERHIYAWLDGNDTNSVCKARIFPDYMEMDPEHIDLPSRFSYACDRIDATDTGEKIRFQHQINNSGAWIPTPSNAMEFLNSSEIPNFKLDYWKIKIDNDHSVKILIVIENHNSGGG